MSDEDRRSLERRARAGDTDAADALKRADERAGPQCPHVVVSKRIWVAPGGECRNDLFCLACGVNMEELDEDGENQTFDDCVPSRETLRRIARGEE